MRVLVGNNLINSPSLDTFQLVELVKFFDLASCTVLSDIGASLYIHRYFSLN